MARVLTISLAIYLRWCVALNGYSGEAKPPRFGDFEAQRHWMEITLHLPAKDWYYYDLDWWGLDYPPLTAYVSWICGWVANRINPDWVALDKSRGFESPELKTFMRATVLVCDFTFYFTAIWLYSHVRFATFKPRQLVYFLILMQPALIIIDHGHFQYNSVMLGLTAFTVACFYRNMYLRGSVAFVLSLCFKQMALYYALPIFVFLLAKCFKLPRKLGLQLLIQIGLVVILTFFVMFYPFRKPELLLQSIHRIFPTSRGVFEDKVASFWCAISLIFKVRERFSHGFLVMASLAATLLGSSISLIDLFVHASPLKLVYSLANVSLSFFLFSFHVHEKTILLPLLPISLLHLDEPFIVTWFGNLALFSMYHPLLKRDKLEFAYLLLLLFWNFFTYSMTKPRNPLEKRLVPIVALSYLGMIALHVVDIFIVPPKQYPDLWTMGSVVMCCSMFIIVTLYLNIRQLTMKS